MTFDSHSLTACCVQQHGWIHKQSQNRLFPCELHLRSGICALLILFGPIDFYTGNWSHLSLFNEFNEKAIYQFKWYEHPVQGELACDKFFDFNVFYESLSFHAPHYIRTVFTVTNSSLQLYYAIRNKYQESQVFQTASSASGTLHVYYDLNAITQRPRWWWRCRWRRRNICLPKHWHTRAFGNSYVTFTDGCALAFSLQFLRLTLVLPFHLEWAWIVWVEMNWNMNTNFIS